MIFDKFIEFLLLPVDLLIKLLPDMSSLSNKIPAGVLDSLGDLFGAIGYIVPWKGLLPIFGISLALLSSRIIWALIIRVKSFIPTMGA